MIKKAAEVNAASRDAMAKMRQSKGERKSSLLQGGGAASNNGTQSHALLLGVFERRLVCLLDILVRSLTCAKHCHDAASTYQATRHGTAVEEDPITLIITPRSLRIIDRLV